VEHDTERDYFMSADEALAYGIVDKIIKWEMRIKK
jgi:ATP-dependent protease ClpP protease subunit